jgi:hypothetical protein
VSANFLGCAKPTDGNVTVGEGQGVPRGRMAGSGLTRRGTSVSPAYALADTCGLSGDLPTWRNGSRRSGSNSPQIAPGSTISNQAGTIPFRDNAPNRNVARSDDRTKSIPAVSKTFPGTT